MRVCDPGRAVRLTQNVTVDPVAEPDAAVVPANRLTERDVIYDQVKLATYVVGPSAVRSTSIGGSPTGDACTMVEEGCKPSSAR